MIDFLMISTRSTKRGAIEIYPKFIIKKSSDLMIRGGDFYAIWIEERGLWSTDEQDALQLIDRELDRYAEESRQRFDSDIKVLHMWDAESGMIDSWHKYCQKQMPYNYIIEMICDWWAFSWQKGKLDEIFGWYDEHCKYMKLHPKTRKTIEDILEKMKTKLDEIKEKNELQN